MNKVIPMVFFLVLLFSKANAQELEPTETDALFECVVTDDDKIPEENALIHIKSNDNSIVIKGKTDIDGKFTTLIPEGSIINISVQKFGKDFSFNNIEIPIVDGASEIVQPLRIKLVISYIRGFTLNHVYFDVNKWDIRHDAHATLNKLYTSLAKKPSMIIEIAGHTDNVGKDESNLRLSQKRADAIRNYLIKKGINENRILAKGYGEHQPHQPNDKEQGRASNRRIEVKVIEE